MNNTRNTDMIIEINYILYKLNKQDELDKLNELDKLDELYKLDKLKKL